MAPLKGGEFPIPIPYPGRSISDSPGDPHPPNSPPFYGPTQLQDPVCCKGPTLSGKEMVGSAMVVRRPVLYRAAWYLTFWSGNKLKKKKKKGEKKKELYKHPTVITLEPTDVGKPRWNPWAAVLTGCLASCTHRC